LAYEKWVVLKSKKTKIMKFNSNYLNNVPFQIPYKDKPIQGEINNKFLGLEIDKHKNWKMHIQLILSKLSSACYAIRCMKHYSNIETLKTIYYAYFLSIVTYGVIFWSNSTDTNKVFLLQKKIIRTMMGINPRSTCKPFFKNLRILTVPSQYILYLTKFLVNNLEYFTFNSITHTKFTRNRTCLHVPQTNLPLCQAGVYYMSIKIFNKSPKHMADSLDNKKQFIRKLKNVLLDQSFYSVNEFFNYSNDLQENDQTQ
jgi:hypothetical protein